MLKQIRPPVVQLNRQDDSETLLSFIPHFFKPHHEHSIGQTSFNINTRFILQLLKLPTAEAAHLHLSMLIQRLARLMAVEHQVCTA